MGGKIKDSKYPLIPILLKPLIRFLFYQPDYLFVISFAISLLSLIYFIISYYLFVFVGFQCSIRLFGIFGEKIVKKRKDKMNTLLPSCLISSTVICIYERLKKTPYEKMSFIYFSFHKIIEFPVYNNNDLFKASFKQFVVTNCSKERPDFFADFKYINFIKFSLCHQKLRA